jgi:hypothetical protein
MPRTCKTISRWCDRSIHDAGHSDRPNDPLQGRNVAWNPCRGNHLGQRSCASASTGRTYGRKRSDQNAAKHLARRGPSTYGGGLVTSRTESITSRRVARRRFVRLVGDEATDPAPYNTGAINHSAVAAIREGMTNCGGETSWYNTVRLQEGRQQTAFALDHEPLPPASCLAS